ncbi:hypothetical protein QTG54_014811 [Skeletonema marinoi]|uniref:Uncharacterized protein n=1 Tax=Skeletonema marinoi TaxID=267567 RepID=A0A6U3VLX1_9STRA|nr:hypothetical protein QTG54_014811 [Skeletonema marinoi]|mmetsp:Transcript_30869/g.39874  ORF Transcript_30869/g.39874 Transcript_30869/m.39874 type:complete len:186 (+) Transcript_30869:69-626(+)
MPANPLANATSYLSVVLCDGSSRKLIAGWWYFILGISILQLLISIFAMSSRGGTEAFISLWSSLVLLSLCIGGTIIMRKFQTSVAVGFFMGAVVAASQMFFLLFFIMLGYIDDRLAEGESVHGERFTSFVCLVQALLLGAFAATLASHRSEILDQKVPIGDYNEAEEEEGGVGSYEAPKNRGPVV